MRVQTEREGSGVGRTPSRLKARRRSSASTIPASEPDGGSRGAVPVSPQLEKQCKNEKTQSFASDTYYTSVGSGRRLTVVR